MNCLFVSDLHGHAGRYRTLFRIIAEKPPQLVFLGGDLLPAAFSSSAHGQEDFVLGLMLDEIGRLRDLLTDSFPQIYLILGNDDVRAAEPALLELERSGLLHYMHNKRITVGGYSIYGYACVPPSPFLLKDWERYDISRYTDPGSIPPEEGRFSLPVDRCEMANTTIKKELSLLVHDAIMDQAIFLFHAPPYQTSLDRANLDKSKVEGVPLDVHVGSLAVREMIESHQPLLTMHGHVHESPRLTGCWRDRIGRTHLFSAAHDGPELAVVKFDLEALDQASRHLMPAQTWPS